MSWVSDLIGKIPGVGGAINSVAHNVVDPALRGAASSVPGGSAVLGVGDAVGRMIPKPGGIGAAAAGVAGVPGLQSIEDLLGKGKDFLTGDDGGLHALEAAQGVNAAMLGKKSSDFANNAMGSVQQNWDERAPLRSAGMAGMLQPGQGISAKIAAIPNHNLYSQGAPQIGPAVPQGAPAPNPLLRPAPAPQVGSNPLLRGVA